MDKNGRNYVIQQGEMQWWQMMTPKVWSGAFNAHVGVAVISAMKFHGIGTCGETMSRNIMGRHQMSL
jgi:hypothetical protein